MEKKINKIPCLSDKSCAGYLTPKRVNHSIKLKDRTVTVPDIEVWECDLCGERFYPYEASKKIDLRLSTRLKAGHNAAKEMKGKFVE